MQLRQDDWGFVPRSSARPVARRWREASASAAVDLVADRALVGAVRAGCDIAEKRFVARMVCIPRSVRHLNRSAGLGEGTVEDVVQEVFRRVWANLDGFRGEGSLEAWVFGFVQRTVREFARSEMKWRRARRTDDEEAPWLDEALSYDDADVCERLELAEAYERLPEELRDLVEARLLQEASFGELARRFHMSESLAKRRYYEALAMLRAATKERSA